MRDPKINFLPRDSRAEWIIFPTALDARSHPVAMIDAAFRRVFTIDASPRSGRLEIRASKRVDLKINDKTVPLVSIRNWKQVSIVDVS